VATPHNHEKVLTTRYIPSNICTHKINLPCTWVQKVVVGHEHNASVFGAVACKVEGADVVAAPYSHKILNVSDRSNLVLPLRFASAELQVVIPANSVLLVAESALK
jgi:hypothetical protein